jgi:Protein of unknown function (DUF1761)
MPDVELLAVAAATVAIFVTGGAYYAVLGDRLEAADSEMPPWKVAVEVGRCLVLAAVVAGVAATADADTVLGGLALGLALWAGFPLVLLTGAVVHEGTPVKPAAIHAGDWLLKLLLAGVIVSALQ